MRKLYFITLIALVLLVGGCSGGYWADKGTKTMIYDFKEPVTFPFAVDDIRTEVAVDQIDELQQFIFHYKNKQTTQEIRYILSKVIDEPEKLSGSRSPNLQLANGKEAYYQVDGTTQSIWWEGEDGFLARLVYYIDGNMQELNDHNMLEDSELIQLADQVQ